MFKKLATAFVMVAIIGALSAPVIAQDDIGPPVYCWEWVCLEMPGWGTLCMWWPVPCKWDRCSPWKPPLGPWGTSIGD